MCLVFRLCLLSWFNHKSIIICSSERSFTVPLAHLLTSLSLFCFLFHHTSGGNVGFTTSNHQLIHDICSLVHSELTILPLWKRHTSACNFCADISPLQLGVVLVLSNVTLLPFDSMLAGLLKCYWFHTSTVRSFNHFIIFITSYFCYGELNQISKRPNSGVFEGMVEVGSFLVEFIPLFNLSRYDSKCPFGSLPLFSNLGL